MCFAKTERMSLELTNRTERLSEEAGGLLAPRCDILCESTFSCLQLLTIEKKLWLRVIQYRV